MDENIGGTDVRPCTLPDTLGYHETEHKRRGELTTLLADVLGYWDQCLPNCELWCVLPYTPENDIEVICNYIQMLEGHTHFAIVFGQPQHVGKACHIGRIPMESWQHGAEGQTYPFEIVPQVTHLQSNRKSNLFNGLIGCRIIIICGHWDILKPMHKVRK